MFINKILLLSSLLLITCKQTNKQNTNHLKKETMTEKKFEWSPTECVPDFYPAEIYQGDFITDDGKYITIPYGGTIDSGVWGSSGSSWAVGEDLKPVPSQLKIIWISYTENQFYFLDTKLPKEKMTALFEKGFIDKQGKQTTYDNIVVGLAPGGAVSVWLLEGTRTTEVGHYQAVKTDVDIKDWIPDANLSREEIVKRRQGRFSEETKKVLAEQGIPIGKWTGFRERFLWKPIIKHVEDFKLKRLSNNLYNGERYSVSVGNPILDNYENFPPPKRMAFSWFDKNDNQFGCKVKFNEKEIWEAFKKIYKNPKTKQAELVFKIDKYNSFVDIFLKSENDSIKIEKAKIKVYHVSPD